MRPFLYVITAVLAITLIAVGYKLAPYPQTYDQTFSPHLACPIPKPCPTIPDPPTCPEPEHNDDDCPTCPDPIICPTTDESTSSFPSPPKDDEPYCAWVFEKYEMSTFEKIWVNHSSDPNYLRSPCKHFYEGDNERMANTWYDYTAQFMNTPPTQEPDPEVFSRFIFNRPCKNEQEIIWIEPIALSLRNPLFCKGYVDGRGTPKTDVVDKSHILVDWEMKEQAMDSKGKVYLFDMGASLYNTGAGGASQSWFISQIETRGLKLDGIWAWEYTTHDAKKVFADIPERLWPIYHWYNIPVDYKLETMSNPWNVIRQVVTAEDMVIVKIDIDTPVIEQNLVQQLEDSPELAGLVDLLFYEDHIDVAEMNPYFGTTGLDTYTHAVASFEKLREMGIRAHPWV